MLLTMSLCVDIIVNTTCFQFRFFSQTRSVSRFYFRVVFFGFAKRSGVLKRTSTISFEFLKTVTMQCHFSTALGLVHAAIRYGELYDKS